MNKKVISKYNLDVDKIANNIREALADEVLIKCFDSYISTLNNKSDSSKINFLTDEDLEEYISTSTKEVVKRINELR